MADPITIQGRQLTNDDLVFIRGLIRENPAWHRTKLSKHLCEVWQWHAANGQPKDMACRTMLRKLDAKDLIDLPPPRRASGYAPKPTVDMLHDTSPVETTLREISPIRLIDVRTDRYYQQLASCFLARYHYLGYERPVGESMCYLALDSQDRPIAVLLFGAAAWKTQVRDDFIAWDAKQRQHMLGHLTNNTRFLILPWVRVKCLASHLLGAVCKQLSADYQARFGHGIYLLETFVDSSRFAGTCYRAANWQHLGQTTGRTRQDRQHSIQTSIKDVYVYPLDSAFRSKLC